MHGRERASPGGIPAARDVAAPLFCLCVTAVLSVFALVFVFRCACRRCLFVFGSVCNLENHELALREVEQLLD